MGTTVKRVAAALKRAGRVASIEKGNGRGEVVVNAIACWSVREALAAVPANRDDGDRDYERSIPR